MELKALSPINKHYRTKIAPVQEAPVPTLSKNINLYKAWSIMAKAVGVNRSQFSLADGRNNLWEEPSYDLEKIEQAIDTDSYCNSAMAKYQELIWKSGYEIVSDNPEALSYLKQRIALMEIAMGRSFASLLKEMTDHLVKFNNVFVVEKRIDFSDALKGGSIETQLGQDPIMGYFLIPPKTVAVKRNRNNIPTKYKQRSDGDWGIGRTSTERDPQWPAEEVVHMTINRKTGHVFGTPFLIPALDDVIALRQIEQDMQNLFHRELFPLFKYMITDTDADDPSLNQVETIIEELENMRTEGSVFLPPGHDIDVVGAEGSVLDISPYLNHFKERVAVGLGVFPHHLGMVDFAGANRDMTDRLDQILYDKVKFFQREFEEMVSFHLFNEILLDGGFDPFGKLDDTNSDRCEFRFNEIDTDGQIKRDQHVADLYARGLLQTDEARSKIKMPLDIDIEDTFQVIQAKINLMYGLAQMETGTSSPTTPDGKEPAKPGQRNLPNPTRGSANQLRPQNQSGRSNSPNVRHNYNYADKVEDLIDDNTGHLMVDSYIDLLESE